MFVTYVHLKNWKNFKEVRVSLKERTFLIGANASGKSNFLDVFRFLRDVAKQSGGGLQKAVSDRGGIKKVRCLHARRIPEVEIEVHLSGSPDDEVPEWKYILAFKSEGKGLQRLILSKEQVWKRGQEDAILLRPLPGEQDDVLRLTQTHLEQIALNTQFRAIPEFFNALTYLHLVPQLLKYGDSISGNRLEDDPFGQGFLERVARTSSKFRDSRLKKISAALKCAVPQFEDLKFEKDEATGRPHLEARYAHFRPNAGWQRESQFSDGTLRLLGLLWSLFEGDSLLLLEEPELSLNNEIIKQIPALIHRIQRNAKYKRQILISTHSEALLSNPGIAADSVLCLVPVREGSNIEAPSAEEIDLVKKGFSVGEILLPKIRPTQAQDLSLVE